MQNNDSDQTEQELAHKKTSKRMDEEKRITKHKTNT